MNKRVGKYLRILLIICITLGIFIFLFSRVSIGEVMDVLSRSNPWYLIIAALFNVLFPFISAKRWQIILKVIGEEISYRDSFRIIMASLPLSIITPAKIGDSIRSYYLRDKIAITTSLGGILVERAYDILVLILFVWIGLASFHRYELMGIAITAFIVVSLFLVLTKFNFRLSVRQSLNDKFQNLLLASRALNKNGRSLLAVIGSTFVIWLLTLVQFMFFFLALGLDVPPFAIIANIPVAIFVGMIPITLGGAGTREISIIYLFSDYATSAQLLGVGILISIVRYWLMALMGVPAMRKLM